MDVAIVHYNNGMRLREVIHLCEKAVNKICETCCIKWAFDNFQMSLQQFWAKWHPPLSMLVAQNTCKQLIRLWSTQKIRSLPLSTNKVALFGGMLAPKRPAILMICCLLIKWTLINKYQLLRLILSNLIKEIGMLDFTLLKCSFWELKVGWQSLKSQCHAETTYLLPSQSCIFHSTPDSGNGNIEIPKLAKMNLKLIKQKIMTEL